MIRVRIHINISQVIDIHAVRENDFRGQSAHHNYELFVTDADNKEHMYIGCMTHKYSDGAAKLSAKMLYQYHKWVKR
jgi:hypothetical protein